MMAWLVGAQALVMVLVAPLVTGVIRKVKARLQCRRGADVWQPYRDLAKAFAKEALQSNDASWLTRATPTVVFASTVMAALLVPVLVPATPFGFLGDMLLVVYLLVMARFFTLLAAMDAGSTFTAMGASREATLSALAEPALLMGLLMAALPAGTLGLSGMTAHALAATGADMLSPVKLLACLGVGVIAVVETGRVPIDNPATHLELTMIHEGLVLEYSGRHWALMQWGAAIKQALLLTLILDLFLPWGLAPASAAPAAIGIALAAYVAKLVALAVGVGVLESSIAKMRLFQVPDLIGGSFVFSVLALISFALIG